MTGSFEGDVLIVSEIDYLDFQIKEKIEKGIDFLKKKDLSFWLGLLKK